MQDELYVKPYPQIKAEQTCLKTSFMLTHSIRQKICGLPKSCSPYSLFCLFFPVSSRIQSFILSSVLFNLFHSIHCSIHTIHCSIHSIHSLSTFLFPSSLFILSTVLVILLTVTSFYPLFYLFYRMSLFYPLF